MSINTEDIEKYEKQEPVGVAIITNTINVEVMEIIYDVNDSIIWRYKKSDDTYEYGQSDVDYDYPTFGEDDFEPRPYTKVGQAKIYLNEIAKTGGN